MENATHPFSHLGPAPYRFLGFEDTSDRKALNSHLRAEGQTYTTNMCGGSCDHCGTAIWNVFRFRAADGVEFKVGSTCQEKARKEVGVYRDAALERASDAKRKAAKIKRHAREAAKLTEADAWIREHADQLEAMPHPRGWDGQSFLDQLRWTWENAGTAGKLRAYREALAAV